MGRKMIVSVLAAALLLSFFQVNRHAVRFAQNGEEPDPGQTVSESADPAPDGILKAVLLGDTGFFYCSEGKAEAVDITGVPALFDADDPFMGIFDFSVVDLDRDGEDEVILYVISAAGDMGGKMILHQIGHEVYGYSADNRSLVELKTDGTYDYSDPTGLAEAGIAAVAGFSGDGYTTDKIAYATGDYEGWDSFAVGCQPAMEEEYRDMVSRQKEKQNAERYAFTDENIEAVF